MLKVTLERSTDIILLVKALRKCTDTMDRCDTIGNVLGPNDTRLVMGAIEKGHESVFEHIVYTFNIENISRALLQELSRHRIASPSVQSTRWALRRIINKKQSIGELLYKTSHEGYNQLIHKYLHEIIDYIKENQLPNDIAKYGLPEAFLTTEQLTINCRSLWNLFNLRLNPPALKEFNELSKQMLSLVRKEHDILYNQFK